jgi:hypothetical protein
VEYNFYLDDQVYSTPIIPQKHRSPVFDYRYHHTMMVTESSIKYLKNNALCFKVFGYPDNEHKPFYEQTSGNISTLQTSQESRDIDNSANLEGVSQDFSINDQSSKDNSEIEPGNSYTGIEDSKQKSDQNKSLPKNYDEPQEEADDEEVNDKFDEMFIYGAQQNAEDEMGNFRNRIFAQSVYEKPKELIPQAEKDAYIASQSKDDLNIDARGSSGKKKKKKAKNGKGKDKKD